MLLLSREYQQDPTDQRFYLDMQVLGANVFIWELADESLWPQPVNEFWLIRVLPTRPTEHLPSASWYKGTSPSGS